MENGLRLVNKMNNGRYDPEIARELIRQEAKRLKTLTINSHYWPPNAITKPIKKKAIHKNRQTMFTDTKQYVEYMTKTKLKQLKREYNVAGA